MSSEDGYENFEQVVQPHYALYYGAKLYGIVGFLFWVWAFADCYRRMGGFNGWHWAFIFFPPSTAIYVVLHLPMMLRGQFPGRSGSGKGLFGWGLKNRISKAQRQLRITDTIAARAELAELHFDAGAWALCEAEFKNVLRSDPQNQEALYYIGVCRMKQNDHAEALKYLQQVMDRDRKLRFGKAWLHYTECLIANGKQAEAVDERKKLSRAYPRPLTEFAYAQLLADSGQKDKAAEVLDEMLATSDNAPSEDRVWLKRGKSLLRSIS